MLVSVLSASAQKATDSLYKKQRIAHTDIQLLTSFYTQNGDHSAITGGLGTEWLHVFTTDLTITNKPDSFRTFRLDMGVDVITSASMDNIDFVRSSASRVFHRRWVTPSFQYLFKRSRIRAGLGSGISYEPAYLSIPAAFTLSRSNASASNEIAISLQCYFDDLRWGLLGFNFDGRPIALVYPAELRDTNWFSIHRRNSYNLDLTLSQVINEKMQFALFPGWDLQKGLLSTPYHRVYFNDGKTLRVERLPNTRSKFPLGAQFNWFPGQRIVFRSYYRYYFDNFGIHAHTIQLETPVKITPALTLTPLVRWYTQSKSRYFQPYAAHSTLEEYYTSDYDGSHFSSWKAGLTARYAPHVALARYFLFDAATLRYMHYHRTDKLVANLISLLVDLDRAIPRS